MLPVQERVTLTNLHDAVGGTYEIQPVSLICTSLSFKCLMEFFSLFCMIPRIACMPTEELIRMHSASDIIESRSSRRAPPPEASPKHVNGNFSNVGLIQSSAQKLICRNVAPSVT